MSVKLYEGMFLLDSGQFASDPDGMSAVVTDTLQKAGGEVVASRPWQDGRLAYEIAGRRKGLHFLTFFRMDPSAIESLNRSCRLNDRILRHLVIQQHPTLFDAMVAALTGEQQDETAASDENDEADDATSEDDTD